jgi:hypothetical protein
MRNIFPYSVAVLLMTSLCSIMGARSGIADVQEALSPTPTYDPLVEPVVPENPSEYDLGRNWYWHHCMPCHGDVGQGLTVEFRSVWVSDHQDCWARGCHSGTHLEDSFAIPTFVPAIISSAKLARFNSLEALYDYLKATHPPQYPGHLEDEQYHAIAIYLFVMNARTVEGLTGSPAATAIATPITPTASPAGKGTPSPNTLLYYSAGLLLLVLLAAGIWGWVLRSPDR